MKSEFRPFSCLLPFTREPPLMKSTLEGQTRGEEHGNTNNSKIVRKSYIGKILEREGRITITTPCGCLLRCKRTSLAVALTLRAQKCAVVAAAVDGMERPQNCCRLSLISWKMRMRNDRQRVRSRFPQEFRLQRILCSLAA